MFWGPMISVAMAGALALPATGLAAGRTADAPPSTDPVSSIVGLGLSAIGDVFHAVPILGPLATGAAEQVVCAARAVPVFGGAAKAAVNDFDKDQKQKGQCAEGTSATSGIGGTATTPAFGTGAAQGSASAGIGGLGGDNGSPASDAGVQGSSEQSGSPASAADRTTSSGTDHASGMNRASGAYRAPTEISFPKGRFQIRHGGEDDCLVEGPSAGDVATALPGRCDAAATWAYQTGTGELHPADDSAVCLVSPEKNLEMITVQPCVSAKSWTRHWYLSGTRRLFVRDSDEHGSWRFLGAPGALVVGGVDQRDVPAVPVWTFPAA